MDVEQIATLVSNVGFPIAMCIGCIFAVIYMAKAHKEEMAKVSEALNNNTLVMQKLVDKMDEE